MSSFLVVTTLTSHHVLLVGTRPFLLVRKRAYLIEHSNSSDASRLWAWPPGHSPLGGAEDACHGVHGWSKQTPLRVRKIPSWLFYYRWVSLASKEGAKKKAYQLLNTLAKYDTTFCLLFYFRPLLRWSPQLHWFGHCERAREVQFLHAYLPHKRCGG